MSRALRRFVRPIMAGLILIAAFICLPHSARAQDAQATEAAEESDATKPAPARRAVPPKPAPKPVAPKPVAAKPPARPASPVAQQAQVQPMAPSVSQPATTVSTLPNGASAINEIFGDWTVDCRMTEAQKVCVLTQSQGNDQTGQRVFAIELRTPRDGKMDGTILMPFGLRLENGAILRLDDKDLGKGLRFATCVAAGCLLPVSFPTVATDAMKTGKTLTAAALNLSNGDPVAFNISLNGFAAAMARIAQLGG